MRQEEYTKRSISFVIFYPTTQHKHSRSLSFPSDNMTQPQSNNIKVPYILTLLKVLMPYVSPHVSDKTGFMFML